MKWVDVMKKVPRIPVLIALVPIISALGVTVVFKICSSILRAINSSLWPSNDPDKTLAISDADTEMWKCHKCGKPVFFAERKSSIGYDWHPDCLRCEECGKILNPGQHAEHKGIPYCYMPCYPILFGPKLYGHGSRVESHTSFGIPKESPKHTQLLDTKLKEYNAFFEDKMQSNVINSRERNGKLILEGALRIFWDLDCPLKLKEDADERLSTRRRSTVSLRPPREKIDRMSRSVVFDSTSQFSSSSSSTITSPTSSDGVISPDDDVFKTMHSSLAFNGRETRSFDDEYVNVLEKMKRNDEVVKVMSKCVSEASLEQIHGPARRKCKLKRSKVLKRRGSINGHFYNRDTCVFTPESGAVTSVWVTSLVTTGEVINMLLEKFKVTNQSRDFSLFIIKDTGECRRLVDSESPLVTRVLLGPSEEAAKVFISTSDKKEVSSEIAQYINLSEIELNMFLRKFEEEEVREKVRVIEKFEKARNLIMNQIQQSSSKLAAASVMTN